MTKNEGLPLTVTTSATATVANNENPAICVARVYGFYFSRFYFFFFPKCIGEVVRYTRSYMLRLVICPLSFAWLQVNLTKNFDSLSVDHPA